MQQIFVCFVFLLSAWLPAFSYAQVAAPSSFTVFSSYDSAAGVKTLYFPSSTLGTPGTYYDVPSRVISPVSNPGVPMVLTDGGLPKVTQTGELINPSGNRVPVTATGRVSGAAAAKAFGAALLKVVGPVGVGLAVYDVAKELGFTLSGSGSDSLIVQKSDPSICTVAPCYNFGFSASAQGVVVRIQDIHNTPLAACSAWTTQANLVQSTVFYANPFVTGSGNSWQCKSGEVYYPRATMTLWLTNSLNGSLSYVSAPASSSNLLPSSLNQLTDSIAAKSGWPSTSNISRLLSESTAADIKPESVTVTGPATSAGTTSTTVNSNNTTTTTNTTHKHSYSNDKITTINETTVNISNTTTGAPVSTETTTETPTPESAPAETCGLPGSPVCNVKVDETGVPDKTDLNPEQKAIDTFKDIKEFAENPASKLPALPTLNWSFQLPSGCAPLSIPGFAPFLQDIDLCQFTPMFHDIMSIVWLMGGLFGAISMFFRNTFAT